MGKVRQAGMESTGREAFRSDQRFDRPGVCHPVRGRDEREQRPDSRWTAGLGGDRHGDEASEKFPLTDGGLAAFIRPSLHTAR